MGNRTDIQSLRTLRDVVTEEQVETAKRQLKAGLVMNLNNTSTIAEDIGRQVGQEGTGSNG